MGMNLGGGKYKVGGDDGFSIGGLGGKSGSLGDWDVVGKELDKSNPWLQADRERKSAAERARQDAAELYGKTGVLNKTLDDADQDYGKSFKTASGDYLSSANRMTLSYLKELDRLKSESSRQAKDAKATYSNSILPEYKNAMGMAKTNASQAMTLKEASDPNNKVMKGVRDLYDQQGQAARQQGQQDFGVLSALGAQAAQGQFGASGPMTAGQQGQIYAANQSQAGDAYAKAQQRMYDLQQQGIDKGFDQSNQLYEYGQAAQGRYGDSIKNLQAGENSYYDQQGRFRDEASGYAGDSLGVRAGLNADRFNMGTMSADIAKGNAYAGTGREQNALNQLYGANSQILNNDLAAGQANNASKGQFMSSIAQLFAGMSDEREKKGISDISDSDLDEFLGAMEPKTYKYANNKPGTAPGKRVGFMMQDVQGTKLGDAMTRRGPNGELMYDKDNLNGIVLAAAKKARSA